MATMKRFTGEKKSVNKKSSESITPESLTPPHIGNMKLLQAPKVKRKVKSLMEMKFQ